MKLHWIHPKYYYQQFMHFMRFVVRPVANTNKATGSHGKIWGTWSIFVIKIILTIIVSVLVATLVIDPVNQTQQRWTEIYSTGTVFALGMLILPFLEEVAFRLSLRFKPGYLAATLAVLSYYFTSKAIYQTQVSSIEDHFEVRVLTSVLLFCLSFWLLSRKTVRAYVQWFWNQHFAWVFYFFCTTFAGMHTFNYELSPLHLLLMPLITLPKLLSALCYGYIRIQYGFLYALGLHMLWNGMGLIIRLFPALGTD